MLLASVLNLNLLFPSQIIPDYGQKETTHNSNLSCKVYNICCFFINKTILCISGHLKNNMLFGFRFIIKSGFTNRLTTSSIREGGLMASLNESAQSYPIRQVVQPFGSIAEHIRINKYGEQIGIFYEMICCCLRSGIDVATGNWSSGAIGFTYGDISKMYDGKIPEWILIRLELNGTGKMDTSILL